MSSDSYNLLIIYATGDRKVVKNISGYGHQQEGKIFYYVKNGYRSFVPIDGVVFFGREFDYENY